MLNADHSSIRNSSKVSRDFVAHSCYQPQRDQRGGNELKRMHGHTHVPSQIHITAVLCKCTSGADKSLTFGSTYRMMPSPLVYKKQIIEPADTKVLEPAQEEATTHGQHGQLELVVHRNEE